MWRSHFVVLAEAPDAAALARLADGYQLFRETRTGLFYLTAFTQPLRRRPDFGGLLERTIGHRIDLAPVLRQIAAAGDGVAIRPHEFNADLIQQAASLAQHLAIPVLAIEVTDDEYAMAAMVDRGELRYLRFRTELAEEADGATLAEAVFLPETGMTLVPGPSSEIYGLAQTAIADVFGVGGLDLYRYCEDPPAAGKAARDRHGLFKRVAQAPPRVSLADRVLRPMRHVAARLALPFILTGMLVYVLINSTSPKARDNLGVNQMFLLGLAVLAIPVALVWLIVRALSA